MDEIKIIPTPEKYLKAAHQYQAVIRILENACSPNGYDDMDVDFTSRIVDELLAAERERVKKELLTLCATEKKKYDIGMKAWLAIERIEHNILELKP